MTTDNNKIVIPAKALKSFDYDDWLEFFSKIPVQKLNSQRDELEASLPVEGYAALCRWLEIIDNPSKMDKLYQGRLRRQESTDIMDIAIGDDDEAFWEALIKENVAQLNVSTSSPQEVARLTQNLGIFRDKLHEIRARKPKKGSTLEKLLKEAATPKKLPPKKPAKAGKTKKTSSKSKVRKNA